ncbi:response regulator [Candidatus Venteria ishoeyi]|uniref:Transcriptional regulatory protein BaeR n=1 Tax=Candidatus Venteria ishoeyi TaxID=1899563 RepID=A0A1H6FGA0_9GAMM|nr:response regulator [Candidatus Venteria ishoeyi]SEH09100.1 Transcriptional regulatory protein BaeR [Candidatus Venteria ishoeyi]
MASRQILIVEDEPKLASLLADYLKQASFIPHILDNGLSVIPWLKNQPVDLILLDLMLPGRDGIELCREIRSFSQVPIIMTTARVEEIDRLLGLELGADDYICKPYSPREVVARVKAIFRRLDYVHQTTTDSTDPKPTFSIDATAYQICFQQQSLDLTPAEFRLLKVLAEHPDKVYSRAQLLDHVYEDNRIVTDRTVDTHIKNLRKKLANIQPGLEIIHSIYGVGYKLVLPVT